MAVFPAGVLSTVVTMDCTDFGMGVIAGVWTAEAETPAIWKATGQLFLETPIPKTSVRGKASIELAVSDQAGFVGRDASGEFVVTGWAYLFTFTPTRAAGKVYRRFVKVPASTTGAVALTSLPDLGQWPNKIVDTYRGA